MESRITASRGAWRYASAVGAVAVATWMRLALDPALGRDDAFSAYYFAIVFAAWLGGRGPALVALGLGLAAEQLFVETRLDLGFALDAGVGLAIAFLGGAMHAARQRAEAARLATAEALAERRRAEGELQAQDEALRSAERRLRSVVDSGMLAMTFWTAAGDIINPNDAYLQLIGFTREEFERRRPTWRAVTAPEFAEIDARALREIAASGRCTPFEKDYVRQDGQRVAVLVGAAQLRPGEGVAFAVDLTERKRAEAALRAAEAELREADTRKDRFLATLAHELRNPLGPICNAVEILRASADEARVEQARAMIDRQVAHMARLIDDLLDVSRITHGTVPLRPQDLDLALVAQQAIDQARPLLDAKQQRLSLALPAEPVCVHGDPLRLVQVVTNLLDNAAKYSPAGGEISLVVEQVAGEAVIRVRDGGRGIAPELLPKVFDMFVHGKAPAERLQGGLGLGLTLARELVEMHGGRIAAHSAGDGQGAEFAVTLPLVRTARPAAPVADAGAAPAPATRPLRVLIIEDNADAAASFAILLELAGHEVHTAADGAAGVDQAIACAPDVAFVDIGLPGMDGYEVARRVRQHAALQHTRLVALSGYGQEEDKRQARDAGFDRHLTKPVELDRVREILVELAAAPAQRGAGRNATA